MGAWTSGLLISWGSVYANHAALRTLVTFTHVGSLLVGGGFALAADRTTLAAGAPGEARLDELHRTHAIVLAALALLAASGLLLFAADADTFIHSPLFWIKIALVALLLANGAVLRAAGSRAAAGGARAWRVLRVTSAASIVLWLLTTLGGTALLNLG
jgi:hypothetical protein